MGLFPGLAICLLAVGFNLLGEFLRDLLDRPTPARYRCRVIAKFHSPISKCLGYFKQTCIDR
jgi:hypothetical protein